MKQLIKIYLSVFIFSLLSQSCYKDEGSSDIIDYNKILSASITINGSVILGDTLRVNPVIKWKYPTADTANFEYEWRQVDSVVSTSRILAYVPDVVGYNNIFLAIKEKSTGIVSRAAAQMRVISAYRAGWLLLTNNGGSSGLNFVRRDTKRDANNVIYYEYVSYPDIYNKNFPSTPLGTNPIGLVTKTFPGYEQDDVLVLQEDASVFLSGSDFSKKIQLKSEFPGQQIPGGAKVLDYADGGGTNYVLTNDGNMYWKRNNNIIGDIHTGNFFDLPIYFQGGESGISKIIDGSIDLSTFVYVYDSLNHRFIGLFAMTNSVPEESGSKLFLVNSGTPPAGFVDLNNQEGYALKFCSDYDNGGKFVNIIKNESTGEYLYQTYRLSNFWSSISVSEHQQEPFAGNGIVTDNSVYYRIKNSSYLFFAESSRLYFYDVNTKSVKLYNDFGSGRIIKMEADAVSGELGVALDNGTFAICSLNNDVLSNPNPGSTGILFQQNNLGNIVDLKWKWGSYFDYLFRRYP